MWNANGLRHNIGDLRHFINKNEIDLMSISETKLTEDIKIKFKNYNIIRKDRTAHGGGLALLIKNSVPYRIVNIKGTVSIEHLCIQLENNLHIIAVYNPPINKFCAKDLETLTGIGSKVLIIGDFNARHTTWGNDINNTNGRTLYKYITDSNLIVQHTNEPTHFPTNGMSPSYIDLVVNKNVSNITDPRTVTDLPSDHSPVLFELHRQHKDIQKRIITSYKTTNWREFGQTLDKMIVINNKMDNPEDIDKEVDKITQALTKAKTKHTRRIQVTNNSGNLTDDIQKLIKHRNVLRKLLQTKNLTNLKTDINRLNRLIRKQIKDSTNEQWQKTLDNIRPGEKALWRIARHFKNNNRNIPSLTKGDQIYMTDRQKADIIGATLEQVQQNDRTTPLEDHINNTLKEYFSNALTNEEKSNLEITSPQELRAIIKILPNNKAPGCDGIENKILKNITTKATVQLTHIINASLRIGYFPKQWKTAIVVPVPKPNKNPTDPCNYRPISLLNTMSKVAEKVILARVDKFNKINNIIKQEQFGFRSGHSTSMQVARIAKDVIDNFNKEKVTAVALLDIEKAFDTVYIDGIVYKLIKYKFPGYLVSILNSYLKDRQFAVKIGNCISNFRHPQAGVPQGSVLGPAIFNYYINDIPSFEKTKIAIYADDTAIYAHSFNAQVATKQVQIHLDMILQFAKQWKIKINNTKTEYFIFSKKFTNLKVYETLKVDGVKIQPSKLAVKYLGVYLDKTLSFIPHVNNIIKKGNGAIRLLYPLLNKYSQLSQKNKKLLYTAVIRPILTYAAPVWSSISATQVLKIQRMQNKCLRLVLNGDRYTKVNYLHKQTGVPEIEKYISKLTTTFYTKSIKNSYLTKGILSSSYTKQKHKQIYNRYINLRN